MSDLSFLDGGGSTGELLRRSDWASTPLGPPRDWPQPLKTLVGIMLASNQPMFTAWGPARTLLYNGYYAGILGAKHPSAMGRDFLDVWSEIRGDLVPIVEQAFRGEPVQMDDIRLLLQRHGYPEETHFSFFYSPVRDSQGEVAGLFCACNEITAQVQAQRRLQLALDAGAIVGTWVWDVADDRFLADERFAKSFGLDEQLCRTGLPLEQVIASIHPDDRSHVASTIEQAMRQRNAYRCEYRVRQSDGVYRWVEASGHVELAATGGLRFPGVLLDIEVRRRAEADRDDAHALLRNMMAAVPGVVYAKDLQGRMLVANRGTADLIGKPPESFLGKTDLYFLEDKAQARAVMATDRRIMASGQAEQVEEDVCLPDGTPAQWLSTKAPLRDAQGRVVGLIGSSVDISERKRNEDAVRESDRRKSEFLAVLSHELRNPLAPIRTGLALLERVPPGSPAATRVMQVIHRQSEHLTRLVDDLLDLTRISSGKIELRRTRFDLRDLVRRVAEDFHSQVAEAQLQLRVEVAPQPLWLDADETRISQIAGNLLHNAIKFTPPGGTIHLAGTCCGDTAQLTVRDTGAGMEPQSIDAMFEPFAQGHQNLARSKGGLGLGLPLVKGLVEKHGGTVVATSAGLGTGSQLVVTLPLAVLATQDQAARAARPGPSSRSILIVEDNADAARTLAELLELEGHSVRIAGNGRAGLEAVREAAPEVVLCDIGLPDMDGYALARAMRSEPGLQGTRLVALSGYAQPEDQRESRAAGFDDHLAKPADLDQLIALLS